MEVPDPRSVYNCNCAYKSHDVVTIHIVTDIIPRTCSGGHRSHSINVEAGMCWSVHG